MTDVDQDDRIDAATLAELGHRARMAEVHTAIPGRVVSYADGRADVRPLVQRVVPAVDGTSVLEDLPVVRSVPVLMPRGGGFFVHLPLAAGDDVLLVISEADPARYLNSGEAGAPIDHRRHHLAHAFAIPGVVPTSGALEATDAIPGTLVIGKEGDGPIIQISEDGIVIGRNAVQKAARAASLGQHLAAIAQDLATLAAGLGGAPIAEPALSYGPATGRPALNAAFPIPAEITVVE